jgi:peptide/nickel transport system permease protein
MADSKVQATKVAQLNPEGIGIKEESPFAVVMKRFRKHKLAMISIFVISVIFFISVFAKQIAPYKPDALKVGNYFKPFGFVDQGTGKIHFLGTDDLGRDYFSRIVYAGRISLTVAIFSVIVSEVIGIFVGAIAGYFGGFVDNIIMRIVEIMLTLPELPLLLIISSMLLQNENLIPIPKPILVFVGQLTLLQPRDARQVVLIIMVLAGLGWMTATQLMRGSVLALREQTYVEAARSLGASPFSIILRHMIPNAMAPIIVNASLGLAGFVVAEAALSFLGFGIRDPIPTWGNMLAATQQFMNDRPWLPFVPGLPIFLCSLCFNYIGDGLRDALDPRLKM